ncbi:MAG: hypothetical protein K9N46_13905 [Candidatus Marinimicrobia bacterium]|nr:hypothetical protein [Candidatus Neomarinimicrobiota bacterium]MCF7829041.1 hypothetical protein [Candidatus Neomarinimicrobiota bacterium]MCF7881822.1 hypothetical protein [Candidatus Neomarinimicrobiota bacterium]
MSETLTIKYKELLSLMESVENGMKQYYIGLAERFTNRDLQHLWIMMAQQEETHIRLVRLMRKRSARDEDLQNSEMEVSTESMETIRDFLDNYQKVLDDPELSIKQGFQLALTLESLELEPIYKPFIAKQDEPTQDVLEELLESEDMHLNILVKSVKRHINDKKFHQYADSVLQEHTAHSN